MPNIRYARWGVLFASLIFTSVTETSAFAAGTLKGSRTEKSTPELIYHNYCSVCHGDKGDGRSRAENSFVRPPRDFTAPEAKNLTRDYMIAIVKDGKAGTAMVGWSTQLDDREIEVVVDYVRAKFMGQGTVPTTVPKAGGAPPAAAAPASPPDAKSQDALAEYMALPLPGGLKGNAAAGAAFYNANCATCHGVKGDGQGPRAYFIRPVPRNFLGDQARNTLNRPLLFDAVSKGRNGTEMPAWSKVISDQEIANVAEYVFQSFIRPGASATAKADKTSGK